MVLMFHHPTLASSHRQLPDASAIALCRITDAHGNSPHAGKQLRRDHEDSKSSNGASPKSNDKKENGAMGIQKGDEVYHINSPEFTGGLGNREVIAERAPEWMTSCSREFPIDTPGQIILWASCPP